jgi:hypothetical protein
MDLPGELLQRHGRVRSDVGEAQQFLRLMLLQFEMGPEQLREHTSLGLFLHEVGPRHLDQQRGDGDPDRLVIRALLRGAGLADQPLEQPS